MPHIEIKRKMSPRDIAQIETLLAAAAAIDGHPPLSDHLVLDLKSGGGPGFVGVTATNPDNDDLVAYAQLSAGNESSALEIVLHPDVRSDFAALTAELIQTTLSAMSADGGGTVHWWVAEPSDQHYALAADAGMHVGRTLLQMRRVLPTSAEVSVATRAFRPDVDDDAWIAVNNRAFKDHGEQGGWTRETLRKRLGEAWFDPEGFRLHERDGTLAAFCWTKVHPPARPGDLTLGEIYVIAVDPAFHGLGLGTQLTLAGLAHLSDQGITRALLYVDASNTAAMGLYDRLGFFTHASNIAFTADVLPTPQGD